MVGSRQPGWSVCRAVLAGIACALLSPAALAQADAKPGGVEGQPAPQPAPTFDVYWWVGSPQTGDNLVTLDFHGIPINQTGFRLLGPVGLYPVAGVHLAAADPTYMERHLTKLRQDVESRIPADYNGYVSLDWENWFPLWMQTPNEPSNDTADAIDNDFRDDWTDYIRSRRPELLTGLGPEEQQAALISSYEQAAKEFLLASLLECKRVRPQAKWGFYLFPFITSWNVWSGDMPTLRQWHDERLQWLWDASDAIFPCIYQSYDLDPSIQLPATPDRYQEIESTRRIRPEDNQLVMDNMVDEAVRVARGKPVLPFVWSRFPPPEGNFERTRLIGDLNLEQMLETPRRRGCVGIVIWDYFYTPRQGVEFVDFFDRKFGPRLTAVLSTAPRSNVNYRMGLIYRQPNGQMVILRGDAPVDQPEGNVGPRLLGDSLPTAPSPAPASGAATADPAAGADPASPPGDGRVQAAPPPKPRFSKNKRIQIVQHDGPRPKQVESAGSDPQSYPPAQTTMPANKPLQGVGRMMPPIVVRTMPARAPDRPGVDPVPVPPRKYRPLPPWVFVSGAELHE